ncbi:MAG: metallophosphoesterase [Rubrobacteraceae bacterium]|jgi:predicted MPP superfamily phosphohydrolase|nr:metallophosphoesterase [Rubrobacteraceae bacterium]MDQ5810028.1 metallophosphoesterase [Actinomycetota bacterium]
MGRLARGALRVDPGKMAAAAALLGAGCYLYGREVEIRRVEIKPLTLTLPRLAPEFDGYRIVQIGDIHLDDWTRPERLSGIVAQVNAQRPDLIAIMGDFASRSAKQLDTRRLTGALRELRARDGVLTILGNHDYLTGVELIRRCIRGASVTELVNDVHTLRRGKATLHVAGVDDVMEGESRLDLVLRDLPDSGAAILLAHEPDFADVSAATGRFDLQLSGHSHGGQVRVPLLMRLALPPFSQRYTSGLYRVDGMLQYTNRGLGFVDMRLRLLCRPEITVLTLRSPGGTPEPR